MRVPFRSHYLHSWDSANYALAMERIDIATHRPHPPGYVGYVMAARGLDAVLRDPNAALVCWNIIAASLIALLVLRIAWDLAPQQPRPVLFVAAATSLVMTSPLLWFYSEVAEIYPSELLGTLVLGFCAWRTAQGDRRGLFHLAVAIPLVAFFKLTAALLMLPLAAWAWRAGSRRDRVRAGALLAACAVLGAGVVLATTPGLTDIIWNQFVVSTSSSRVLAAGDSDILQRFNRNARDTLTAGVSTLGVVNVFALMAWMIRDRRLPAGIGRWTALFWAGPWLFLCVVVHIGKPGYILPILPVAALILAGFYARLSTRIGIALVVIQATLNVAQFVLLRPFPDSLTGGRQPYRSKSLSARIASDLQLLTFGTAATISETDEAVRLVLFTAERLCPSRDLVVIAALDPIDARRAMWHLPAATVVHTEGPSVVATGRHGTFREVTEETPPITTTCPVLWLAADDKPFDLAVPPAARHEPGVGFVLPPGTIRLAPAAIVFEYPRAGTK